MFSCQTCGVFKKKRIALDCGHGDYDPGFVRGNLREKDINLAIGLKTMKALKKAGFEVFMTRDDDSFLALDHRTTQTNHKDVDLFISIHTNANSTTDVSGIETFCIQPSLFVEKFKKLHKHDHLLAQYAKTQMIKSEKLARLVHTSVLGHAKKQNPYVVDRKVKFNTAQVLLGTEVPSILLELGFLSHHSKGDEYRSESKLLQSDTYQNFLAEGISAGIKEFFKA